MNKIGVIFFAVIIVVLVASVVFWKRNESSQVPTDKDKIQISEQGQTGLDNNSKEINSSTKITHIELAKHAIQSDCWISYKGKIYDLTAWLPHHPGSAAAIVPYCGKAEEFEKAFTDKHGTSQVEKLMEEGIYKGDLE